MKKIILAAAFAAFALPLSAQEFRAPMTADRDLRVVTQTPPQGSLQAAFQQGEVRETIVPDADTGSSAPFVAYEESDPFLTSQHRPRPVGVRLLSFPVW